MPPEKKQTSTAARLTELEAQVVAVDNRLINHADREEERHDVLDESVTEIKQGLKDHAKDFRDHKIEEAEAHKGIVDSVNSVRDLVDAVRALLNKYAIGALVTIIVVVLLPLVGYLLVQKFG